MERLWCLMTVRQEIDVPQPEQLEFVPCGQLLQDEEEEPCPDKRHISLILKVMETFPTMPVQKGSLGIKRERVSPHSK